MLPLRAPKALGKILLRLDGFEVADRHTEAVREQVGKPQDKRHRGGKTGTNRARDHRKGRHTAVDAPENRIGNILRHRRTAQAVLDRIRVMLPQKLFVPVLLHPHPWKSG